MLGTLTIGRRSYEVAKAELHVPVKEECRILYLSAWGIKGGKEGGLVIYGAELALLNSPADLDGARIHVRPDGETYEDDTLGTDIIGWNEEESTAREDEELYNYGDICIDFESIGGNEYRCRVKCDLALIGPPTDGPSTSYPVKATAEFLAIADEVDPLDGEWY